MKKALGRLAQLASRRKIGRIMKQLALVSKYAVAQFKPHKQSCNEDPV